jgi:hypothetical protein
MGGGTPGGGFGGRPGGSFGGGFPGGGWGGWEGGWRPRGPWYGGPIYRRPFFGGWGWLPGLFLGPRYGWGYGGWGGGGFGCGGFGCLGLLIFVCVIIGLGSAFGGGYRSYGYNQNTNPNYNYSNPSAGGPSLANEAPAVQTQTAKDLTELHAAFDSRIPDWQNQLSSNQEKSIPPADAGLTQDNNTKAVIYGKCGSGFYVYVVENTRPDNVPADGEGYAYTTASSPGACHPAEYTVYQSEDVGGGWYFVYLQSVQ